MASQLGIDRHVLAVADIDQSASLVVLQAVDGTLEQPTRGDRHDVLSSDKHGVRAQHIAGPDGRRRRLDAKLVALHFFRIEQAHDDATRRPQRELDRQQQSDLLVKASHPVVHACFLQLKM